MKNNSTALWRTILLVPAMVLTTLLFKSCELPENEKGPSSKIQSFASLYSGEWELLGGALTEIDTSIENCNSLPFDIFTTRTDIKYLMYIDTFNWSRDSSFTVSWSDRIQVKIEAPNRPSSCGGPLVKDTFIEHTWKTKIDSFQLNDNLPDMAYIAKVPNSPYKIRLNPIWIVYDKYLQNLEVTLLSETDEPLLTRELWRAWPLITKF